MRSLHICHSFDYGGITTFVRSLVQLNDGCDSDHDLLIWKKSISGLPLNTTVIDISKSARRESEFRKAISVYDKLFIHSLHPFMLQSLRNKRQQAYLFQHGLTTGDKFPWSFFKKVMYLYAIHALKIRVICSSEFAYRKLRSRINFIWKRNILIIPFGIDINNHIIISHSQRKEGYFVLGAAGHLVKQKRFANILTALSGINNKTRIKLKIAGKGPLEGELRSMADGLLKQGVEVNFLGEVFEMQSFYDSLDLFIMPSKHESFGLVVLEALSRKVPVIVYADSGTCVDFIVPGINGYVVRDNRELSDKIMELENIENYNRLKSKIRDYESGNYSILNTRYALNNI